MRSAHAAFEPAAIADEIWHIGHQDRCARFNVESRRLAKPDRNPAVTNANKLGLMAGGRTR